MCVSHCCHLLLKETFPKQPVLAFMGEEAGVKRQMKSKGPRVKPCCGKYLGLIRAGH